MERSFPLLKTAFELIDFDAFQCFGEFLFQLFPIGKMCPLRTYFIRENKQKIHLGQDRVNRAGRA